MHGRFFCPANVSSHIDDYIEPIVIFTTWVKIYSAEYFCNAGVYNWVGWGKLLSSENFQVYGTSNFFHQVAYLALATLYIVQTDIYGHATFTCISATGIFFHNNYSLDFPWVLHVEDSASMNRTTLRWGWSQTTPTPSWTSDS